MATSIQRWTEGTTNRHKLKLKQSRAYHAVESVTSMSLDELFSREPSTVLYIAGAGAAVGITQTQLLAEVQKHGSVADVELDLRYPFAIVRMESPEAASKLKEALHGASIQSLNDRFVFVEYALTVIPFENVLSLPLDHPALLPNPLDDSKLLTPSSRGWEGVPRGLFLIPEFITPVEEIELLQCLEPYPWEVYNCRHVMHFGYEWDYGTSGINLTVPRLPFPEVSIPIVQRMRSLPECLRNRLLSRSQGSEGTPTAQLSASRATTPVSTSPKQRDSSLPTESSSRLPSLPSLYEDEFVPNQLTINKYLAGHSIPPHVDTHSACHELLVSLSLGSSTVMEFAPAPAVNTHCPPSITATNRFQLPLPPRSLLVLSGEARYAWTHAIRGRKSDRIDSIFTPRDMRVSWTFRTSLQPDTCHCNFLRVCDDIERRQEISSREQMALAVFHCTAEFDATQK